MPSTSCKGPLFFHGVSILKMWALPMSGNERDRSQPELTSCKARMTLLAFDLPTEDFLVSLEVAMHYWTAKDFPRNAAGRLGGSLLLLLF